MRTAGGKNAIPTVTPNTPAEVGEQVLWPSNLARVSVHDPSVVYDPSSWSYYIFGSHRAAAKSPNMLTWSTVEVPWAVDGTSGAGNDVAFATPQLAQVVQGGKTFELPAFNAFGWSQKGNASWKIDGNMWAPDCSTSVPMRTTATVVSTSSVPNEE